MNSPEDQKLVTLAQNTLGRSAAPSAAALRDNTGRTYVAISVSAPGLQLDAFEAVLTVALASGITGIESVVAVGEKPANSAVIKAISSDATIFYINTGGDVLSL